MVSGLTGFLFNCPLDMIIERYIRDNFPALRPLDPHLGLAEFGHDRMRMTVTTNDVAAPGEGPEILGAEIAGRADSRSDDEEMATPAALLEHRRHSRDRGDLAVVEGEEKPVAA